MNWSTLLRYRKQVEDLIREEVMVAQSEREQEDAKTLQVRNEIDRIAVDLDQSLQAGVDRSYLELRFRWLEETGCILETQARRLQEMDTRLIELRQRLRSAYHARRIVEIVMTKKEAAYLRKLAQQEQTLLEEVTAHKHITSCGAD